MSLFSAYMGMPGRFIKEVFYDKLVIFFSFFVSEHLYVYLIVCWCLRCWMNSSNSCSVSLFYSFFRWKRLLHGDLQVSKVCS